MRICFNAGVCVTNGSPLAEMRLRCIHMGARYVFFGRDDKTACQYHMLEICIEYTANVET